MKIWTFWHKIPSDNPSISLRICQNRFSAGKGLLEVHQPVRGGEGGQPRELLPAEGLCSPNISLSSISTRPRGHHGIGDIDIRLHGLQEVGRYRGGEKFHVCKMCAHLFTFNAHLKQHMLVYTGEKVFSCKQCEYTFTQAANLKRHMTTHSAYFLKTNKLAVIYF